MPLPQKIFWAALDLPPRLQVLDPPLYGVREISPAGWKNLVGKIWGTGEFLAWN